MKQIPLTQGQFALVDDADFDWLSQWKWFFNKGYAKRNSYYVTPCGKKKRTVITMHGEILRPDQGLLTDHVDMNTINNQRHNLRPATHAQNSMNRNSYHGSSCKFKGVSWHKAHRKFMAYIRENNKMIHLGYFSCQIAAAEAYNNAATIRHGEFARLNIL